LGNIFKFNHSFSLTKVTGISSLEFLWVFIDSALSLYEVVFEVFYDDGTSDIKTVPLNNELNFLYVIPSGFTQNNLGALQPGKRAFKYTVHIDVFGGTISEKQTYLLDYREFEFEKYFVFQSPIGFPDTMRLTGSFKRTFKFQRDIVQTAIISDKFDRALEIGQFDVSYVESQQEFLFRSGWLLDREEMERYKAFLSSKYILEVGDILEPELVTPEDDEPEYYVYFKQPYKKMYIVNDSIDFGEVEDGKWSIQFSMRYAFTDKNYDNVPQLPLRYYDSEVRFLMSKYVLSGLDDVIECLIDADYYEVVVNENPFIGNTFNVEGNNTYEVIIRAKNLRDCFIVSQYANTRISVTSMIHAI
jgi:hypothetical protein